MPRVLISLALAALATGSPQRSTGAANSEAVPQVHGAIDGEWRVDPKRDDGRVEVELKREWDSGSNHSSWSSSFDIRRRDLKGVTEAEWSAADTPVSFALERDPGSFQCDGRLHRGRGSGRFVFVPNAEFRVGLERMGIRNVTAEDLARLSLHDVSREWIRSFEARGVRPLTLDELIRLKVHDVTGDYVDGMRAAGLSHLEVDELIQLKVNGVEPSYVREMAAGSDLSVDEIVRLKVHGVVASYAEDLVKLGFPRPSADELVRLRVQGVAIAFVRDLRDLGYERLTPDDWVRLQVNGVTSSSVRRAMERHGRLPVEELIRLKQRGEI